MTSVRVWLSPDFFHWETDGSGSSLGDPANVRRPYQMWEHALRRLESATTDLDRVDVVTALNRVVANRLRSLNALYHFKALPVADKPKDPLKLLEMLGVVRPLMLSRLIQVRNAVEHEDASPPSQEQCGDLCEFVWYFLRSTDRFALLKIDLVTLAAGDADGHWLEVTWKTSWVPRVRGWMGPNLYRLGEVDGWVAVSAQSLESAEQRGFEGRKPDDMYLIGEVRGAAAILELARLRLAPATM